MNQLFTQLLQCGTLVGASFLFHSCQLNSTCFDLPGQWTNREGQVFLFQPDGKGLWLIKFGSEFDTFPISYQYDCSRKPVSLDLSGFQTGPLTGKTLFGILEWTSDSSFRFDAEPGTLPEVRPKTFNSEQTMKFYKKRE